MIHRFPRHLAEGMNVQLHKLVFPPPPCPMGMPEIYLSGRYISTVDHAYVYLSLPLMISVNTTPSTIMISSWINLVLYTAEVLLFIYYDISRRPRHFYRYGPMVALIIDTAATAVICAEAYLTLVDHQDSQLWTVPFVIILTVVSALLEQSFLIYRFRTLTNGVIITAILCVLVFTHAAVALISTVYSFSHSDADPIGPNTLGWISVGVSYILSALADVAISSALVRSLGQFKIGSPVTKSLIRQASVKTMAWGFISAMTTLTVLILLYVTPSASTAVFLCSGRVYSLTVLIHMALCILKSEPPPNFSLNFPPSTIERTTCFTCSSMIRKSQSVDATCSSTDRPEAQDSCPEALFSAGTHA
ncbi:uncharacterized protein EV420DRAFT_516499 [Desarmillaria tabescens]|uniref:Transmembrane protein n=1 Tax=Armillaria tabescens TaxID=1929756 RepID=A0AA39N3X3_ARMTA|nr:uncharacterized protein EV420DRAFT_516499 [Desarmillaria tabescens]KAK0457276.1 hypothetical protein EV420DRAFT_516499 [Desarmillaria tabescens]